MNSAYLIQLANDLDAAGDYRAANIIDYCICKKAAVSYQSPMSLADSLYRVIKHLMQRTSLEKQQNYLQSIRKGLMKLSPVEISTKKSNPASSIGAAINIVKNVLIGQPVSVIVDVLAALQRTI